MGYTKPISAAEDVYWFESAFDAMQHAGRVFTSYQTQDKKSLIVNDMTNGLKRHVFPLDSFDFNTICETLGIDRRTIGYEPCNARYKDWNDQLLDKPIMNETSEVNIYQDTVGQEENQSRGFRR